MGADADSTLTPDRFMGQEGAAAKTKLTPDQFMATQGTPGAPDPFAQKQLSAGPQPGIWERIRESILGGPHTGETALGRSLGMRYESASEPHPDVVPLVRPEAFMPGTPTTVPAAVAKTALEFTGGLTTPENLLMMAGSGGLGMLGKISTLLPRTISAGFGIEMLRQAYQQSPEVQKAWKAGDAPAVASAITRMALSGAFGSLAFAHAFRGTSGRPAETPAPEAAPGGRIAPTPRETRPPASPAARALESARLGANVLTPDDFMAAEEVRPQAAPAAAPAAAPSAPQKPLWELSYDEVTAAETEAKRRDKQDLIDLFGEDGARRYEALQRQLNSTDDKKAEAAQFEIAKMEARISPEDRVQKLYGIGDTRPQLDEIRDFRKALGSLDWDSPEALGKSLRFAVTGVGDRADPAEMSHEERLRYAQLRYAITEAERHGWDPAAVSEAAIRAASARFEPGDAEFMLRRFLDPEAWRRMAQPAAEIAAPAPAPEAPPQSKPAPATQPQPRAAVTQAQVEALAAAPATSEAQPQPESQPQTVEVVTDSFLEKQRAAGEMGSWDVDVATREGRALEQLAGRIHDWKPFTEYSAEEIRRLRELVGLGAARRARDKEGNTYYGPAEGPVPAHLETDEPAPAMASQLQPEAVPPAPAAPEPKPATAPEAASGGQKLPGWLGSLPDDRREAVFALMRQRDEEAQRLLEQHRQLSPPAGQLAAGGSHVDPMMKAYAIEATHRALSRGATIEEAIAAGKAEADLTARKFNATRPGEYQVHRPTGMMNAALDHYGRLLREAAGMAPQGKLLERRPPANAVLYGGESTVRVPGETTTYKARYSVRELDDVQASHMPHSFEPNPDYQYSNERDYSQTGAAARVVKQSTPGIFDPTYLTTESPTAEHGAPVVDRNGNVLGGNSRAMTIARVYRRDGVDAEMYRNGIMERAAQFGIDPAQIERFREPVLVREVNGGVDAVKAIADFNKKAVAELTPEERAVADGKRLSDATVREIAARIGDVGEDGTLADALKGEDGAALVNNLVRDGVLTEQEKGGYIDERGFLTPEAKSRIAKALVGRLFETPAEYRETTPAMRAKLERIAPQVLRVEGREGWNITPQVREALALVEDARVHKMPIEEAARQTVIGGGSAERHYSPDVIALAKTLELGPLKAAGAFRRYANDEALSREGAQATMYEPPTREEAFADAFGGAIETPAARVPQLGQGEERTAPYVMGASDFLHGTLTRLEQIRVGAKEGTYADAYVTNLSGMELTARVAGREPDTSAGRLAGVTVPADSMGLFIRRLQRRFVDEGGRRIAAGAQALLDAAVRAKARGKSLALVVDHQVYDAHRETALDEELGHALQISLPGGSTHHLGGEMLGFLEHPLAQKAAKALARYDDVTRNQLAVEIGVRLMRTNGYRELGLEPAEARSLAAHYVQLLRREYGSTAPRELAKQVFDALRPLRERGKAEPGALPAGAGPEGRGGPPEGTGPPVSREPAAVGDTGRRQGHEAPRDNAAETGTGQTGSLFGPGEAEQIAREAAADRDRLTGERLTAQLNAPLSREEQLAKLRRKPAPGQPGLFEPPKEEPEQFDLFGSRVLRFPTAEEREAKAKEQPDAQTKAELRAAGFVPGETPATQSEVMTPDEEARQLRAEDPEHYGAWRAEKLQQAKDGIDAWRRVNGERQQQGLPPLQSEAELRRDMGYQYESGVMRQAFREMSGLHLAERGGISPDLATLGVGKFVKEDVIPAVKRVASDLVEARDDIRRVVAPQLRGSSAELTGLSLRQRMAQFTRRFDQAEARLRDAAKFFNRREPEQNYQFIDQVEHGHATGDENLDKIAGMFRGILDQRRREVHALGEGALERYYRDYFPHIFERPEQAAKFVESFFGNKRNLEGPKSFLKHREFPTFREALDAGMKPVSDNPVQLVLLKAREMDRYLLAHHVLRDLAATGVAKRIMGSKLPDERQQELLGGAPLRPEWLVADRSELPPDFKSIRDPVGGGRWYAEEGAADVLNNFLSPGLRGRSGLFRTLLGVNNVMNQANLGLSAFHARAVAISSMASRMGVGMTKTMQGHPIAGMAHILTSPAAPFIDFVRGSKMLHDWFKPGSEGAPVAAMTDALMRGGGRARMDAFYANNAAERMMQAFRRGNFIGGALRSPFAAIETLAKPLMGELVPRLKMGMFADLAANEMERLGPGARVVDVERALASAWDHVENRLGEMTYDNRFWNRTFKDIAMLSVRSVGWNLGDFLEAKSAVGAVKRMASGKMPGDLHGLGFVMGYTFTAALMGAMMQYLHTGNGPRELRDYFFPKREDGHRVVAAPYVKDAYQFARDPVRTVENKAGPLISTLVEMVHNRDYYDRPIRNSDAPLVKQLEQEAQFVGRQFLPFTVQPYTGGQTKKPRPLPGGTTPEHSFENFVGITPAPAALQPGYRPRRQPHQ